MNTRAVLFGLWLVAGCGPGSDGSSDSGSSSSAAGTEGATSTSGGTTTTTATGSTGTTADSTGTPTTTAGTTGGTTTGATTGGVCEIAGVTDCAQLVALSGELTLEECEMCQGAPCDALPACSNYPCVDGGRVIRGCCEDSECADLTPFCGMFIAVDHVCVESDDI